MPETERTDCKICSQSNNVDDMVSCDQCRDWYHFGCVNVEASVVGREWICAECEKIVAASAATVNSTVLPAPTTTSNNTTSNGNSVDMREVQMKILQEQQALLERELVMQHEQELARKKMQLEKLMLKAKLEILGGADNRTVLSESLQSTGDGVAKVESWMKRMEIEAKNLSIATLGERAKVTSSIMPSFGRSSTPTTVAVPNVPQFDESSPPASQVTTVALPVNSSNAVSTPRGLPDPNNYRQLGAIPKQVGYPYATTGCDGLTFSQVGSIPAVSACNQVSSATSTWNAIPIPVSAMAYPPASLSNPFGIGQSTAVSNAYATSSAMNPLLNPASVPVIGQGDPVVSTSVMSIPVTVSSMDPANPVPFSSMNQPIRVPVSSVNQPIPAFGMPIQPAPGNLQPNPSVAQLVGPSSQQLLARQVIPRELPVFDGNPDDWPIFYSSYVNSSSACGFSDVENLARLQKSLKGRAFEAVKSRLLLPACVPQVIATLFTLFGRPELIIHTLLNKIREIPAPKGDRLDTLISFGTAVQNLCDHLVAAGQVAHLCNPSLMQELAEKLPAQLRLNWALYKKQFEAVDLRVFSQYMSMLVAAASDVTMVTEMQQKPARAGRVKEKSYLNAHSTEEVPVVERSKKEEVNQAVLCLVCEDPKHKVKDCGIFKKMDQDAKWKVVQNHHLCRICLGKHGRRPCKSQARCTFEGCQLRHHPLLHAEKDSRGVKHVPKATDQVCSTNEQLNAHHYAKQGVLFRMLPVQLRWNGKMVETYAFLDDGSSLTLVDQSIIEQLGIDDGEPLPLCLSWTSNVTRYESKSQRVRIQVCGVGMKDRFWLNDTRTVANLNLPEQTLDYGELSQRFNHLRGLPVRSYKSISPGILIGSNNASLLASIKIHEGQLGDPIATKTRLGWTICGTAEGSRNVAHFAMHICECTNDQKLHDMVKRYFTVESVGVSVHELPESEEDQRARKILEQTTKRVSGRFETGLIWRHNQLNLPNSFPMAMKRWECFERRMESDTELKASVHQQIKEYLESGYIHVATPAELSIEPGKEWYLPLGAVRNPKKPGKIRLVWDAAAKVKGISLNSVLLKGPDFLVALLTVLCGFRERKVAISGDIKQMFHQYYIRQADRAFQKFVFRENPYEAIQVYVLDVGSFGSTCSPSQAQFIKNLNAKEHEELYPRAAKAITTKHYVDDYLDSFDSEEEAIEVANEVASVHAKGGFTIRNWLSSSQEVLRRVGEPATEAAKMLNFSAEGAIERVLGMLWEPREDKFTYAIDLDLDAVSATKRNILRCVMRLFDPLGLISHALIHGKLIIQEAWREQLHWDEEVSGKLLEGWVKWIALLKELIQIRINRPYFPGFTSNEIGPLELHVFTDASENAFACVAYFRAVIRGQVYCSLVMAKAKVAPLKALSVPRLELQGALLGTRLAKTIRESHSLPIKQTFMWTDSTTVLAWIKSDHRRYRQFVAFRVGEILAKTEAAEWKYVPSKKNAADQATKWGKGPCLEMNSSWFRGPDFLYLPEEQWPTELPKESDAVVEELRPSMVHREVAEKPITDFGRFSKWERLLRSVGYVKRFITNCRHRRLNQPRNLDSGLSQEEMQWAENYLWSSVQAEVFPEEVTILKTRDNSSKKPMEKTSKIYKLSPFLDEHGVMRVDSRLSAAPYATYNFKYPIILPRDHRMTDLVVDAFHRKFLHGNQETVVNELRQQFHVSRLRTVVNRVVKNCQYCRIQKAKPVFPRMAPLPTARLTPWIRPFSFVGIDYFGPVQVRIGRNVVKRWIVLFTCMSIRAIHLEVAYSLSSESCKLAIRRFIARRGAPCEIYTDNGTNFQGASRELREEIENMHKGLADVFTNANTKWVFNPPSAPHFGGVWERLVRSVKTALNSLSSSRNPDDETLLTIIVEAESIVNSRPLTFVSLQADEQEALTPNHFILLSSSGVAQPPKTLAEVDRVTRTNWDLARQLVDQFWTRWIREYLPTIAYRSKWHNETEPLKIGDLVVIVDEGTRNGWIRGRIVSIVSGRDGRTRQAVVQTSNGLLRRPVSKLAVLAVDAVGKAEPEVQRYGSGDVADAATVAVVPRPA